MKIRLIIIITLLNLLSFGSYSVNNLAPNSYVIEKAFEYDAYKCSREVEECINSTFDFNLIPQYKNLIETGLTIFLGYYNYPNKNGYVNFLSDKGFNVLKAFEKFEEKINNETFNWEESFEKFRELISFIPRPHAEHLNWNEDLFIDVFPGMNDEEIKFLRNKYGNNISIQLSKKCLRNCLHCAAISKGKKLSSINHMPLPIAIKVIKRISQAYSDNKEKTIIALYDRSEVSDYFDPVLELDAVPIMHFVKFNKFYLSSISHGDKNTNSLYENYLPGILSFNLLHKDVVKYIKNKISNPSKDLSIDKKTIINSYLNRYSDAAKFLDKFPLISSSMYSVYQGKKSVPSLSFRRYYLNKDHRKIISKDNNGEYALRVIDEIIKLQDEVFSIFMKKMNKTRRLDYVFLKEQEDVDLDIQFVGMGAYFLKNLNVSKETIKKLSLSSQFVYSHDVDYVIESDGRISINTPERFNRYLSAPHSKVSDLFEPDSDEFKSFLVILKIIAIGKIDKSIQKNPYFKFLANKMLKVSNNGRYLAYETKKHMLSSYSYNFINFIKLFVLKNKEINKLINSPFVHEFNTKLYEYLKDVPVPLKLDFFYNNFLFTSKNKILEFKKHEPDLYYDRRYFPFEKWGKAFDCESVSLKEDEPKNQEFEYSA